MLTEKQIIQKRKNLLKERRVLKRSVAKKANFFGTIQARAKNVVKIVELTSQIELLDTVLKGNKIAYKSLKGKRTPSAIMQDIIKIRPMVIQILKSEFATRDDDRLLQIRFWEKEGILPNSKMSSFKKRYLLNEFTLADTISRCRRSVQEKHKSLRGKLYDKRHQAEANFETQYKLNMEF
jgi:hypothetical protein